MQLPRKPHLDEVHHTLRYVRATLDYALFYAADVPVELHGYIDADWAAVASAGSGSPAPNWALASSSLQQQQQQQQAEPPCSNSSSATASRALKERDFSLGFNGGSADKFHHPFDPSRSSLGYGFSFDPSPSDHQLPLGTVLAVPPSLNLTSQTSLFSTSNRLIGLGNPDPNYGRQFNISRSSNEDQLLSFYGQRLPFGTRDHDDVAAARASFVSYDAQAQARLQTAGRDSAEEEATGAAAAAGVHESLQLPTLRRAEEAGSSKSRHLSIVSPTAHGEGAHHAWPVNILSRAKPNDSEQGGGANESEAGGEGNAATAITVVDMELLSSRGATQEAEQAQMQQMMQLQQQQQQRQHQAQAHQQQQQRAMQAEPILMRQRSTSGSTIACQDCGNQAKKDCPHSRCRTCCKSRGYECATHIRSTWVPAAKRRERQQAELQAMMAGQPVPKSKRARTLALAGAAAHFGHHHHHHPHHAASSFTSASTGTPPRTTSDFNAALLPIAHQQEPMYRAALPTEVRAQAVFQCVRMTGVTDGQDEFAYRTVVRIGGRTFKGLLHDQGAADRGNVPSAGVAELQLGSRSAPLSSGLIDLTGIYGTPGNTLLGKETLPGPF
ncbi:hypothetical protein L7F22_001138 [Adiantum nelumboides]|nr:hypothetical protein [Adiantum nelumboides]